jgi:hypothetical protein
MTTFLAVNVKNPDHLLAPTCDAYIALDHIAAIYKD